MHLLSLLHFLLLAYSALSDKNEWKVKHPDTVYAWEGACVRIPCSYKIPKTGAQLDNFTLFHDFEYDHKIKDYKGTVLYAKAKNSEPYSQQNRVQFLGNQDSDCTLTINPVRVQDSGKLGLRMTSQGDKWMDTLKLSISKSPFLPLIRLPSEIRESRTVTLTCLLNFTCPEYDIQLRWKGLPFSNPSSDISSTLTFETLSTESRLTFEPQWTHHGMNLTCQVWHSAKKLSEDTVKLDVKYPPKVKIEVSPSETTVMEGESVTMTCQVTSSNPEYKAVSWLKDGKSLSGTGTEALILTLSSVTKDSSGKYCCRAFNGIDWGMSEEVTLRVLYAPTPSKVHIHSTPAEEGKLVELICASLADPPPTNYSWYHNQKEILGETKEKYCITKVFPWHAGLYSCLAENSLGSGRIGPGTELDVQYPPKGVTTVIQSSTPIREGDSVTLTCRYNSSNPAAYQYKWSLHSGTEYLHGELRIPKVAWNTLPISCTACNQWCSSASPVDLDVQYAPKGVKVLRVIPGSEIHAGNRVQLKCNYTKSQPQEVHFFWKKNGSLLAEKGSELNLDSISPEDAGNYSCLVNNSIGQTASEAYSLEVLYAPRRLHVSITPGDRVMEGRKVALTCKSDANPPISRYTWFDWNNKELQFTGQTLRLDPVNVEHSGSYWCKGLNRLGEGSSLPSTLTIYYSPETIGRRTTMGIGVCLAILILAIWGVKCHQNWKRTRSQQGLQENSSGQSFFVRKQKVRRPTPSEVPHSLGCYNPIMEDGISYAALRFPETGTPRTRGAGTSETQGPLSNNEDMVTYAVVQKRHVGDYENVAPKLQEDEGIHYSELVQFGSGERPRAQEDVEYVTVKQ